MVFWRPNSRLPFLVLLHLLLLVHPLWDFFLSAPLSHLIFDWPVFLVFSSFTTLPSFLPRLLWVRLLSETSRNVSLLSLSYLTTTSQLWRLSSRLAHPLSPFLASSSVAKEPSPLSQAMIPPQTNPTPSEGVYVAISVRDIVSISSSIKKTLIHRGISLKSIPLASFLKYASAGEKY
jgi:hypothetical protein